MKQIPSIITQVAHCDKPGLRPQPTHELRQQAERENVEIARKFFCDTGFTIKNLEPSKVCATAQHKDKELYACFSYIEGDRGVYAFALFLHGKRDGLHVLQEYLATL